MISANEWPPNMEYVSCEFDAEFDAPPNRTIDLKSFFMNVTQPTTYGTFVFKEGVEFNGHSHLKFDMDIMGVKVRNSVECSEKSLGNWSAGFSSPIYMDLMDEMEQVNVKKVYRVSTVVVNQQCLIHEKTEFKCKFDKNTFSCNI